MSQNITQGIGLIVGHPGQFVLLGVSLALSSIAVMLVYPALSLLHSRHSKILGTIPDRAATLQTRNILIETVVSPEIRTARKYFIRIFSLCFFSFILLLIHIFWCPFTPKDYSFFCLLDGAVLLTFPLILVQIAYLLNQLAKWDAESL
jgi:hypothetical protein